MSRDPLRAVVRVEDAAGRLGGKWRRLVLSCGHETRQQASALVPQRCRCRDCGNPIVVLCPMDPGPDRLTEREIIETLRREMNQLHMYLEESVRLQSHYAALLNMHDGGERLQFQTVEEWIARVRAFQEGTP